MQPIAIEFEELPGIAAQIRKFFLKRDHDFCLRPRVRPRPELRPGAIQFAPIEWLMRAIAFHHPQIGALDFFISREAISAAQTFATPANAGTIPRLAGIDNLIITRPALGTTHSIERFNNTQRVVESIISERKFSIQTTPRWHPQELKGGFLPQKKAETSLCFFRKETPEIGGTS